VARIWSRAARDDFSFSFFFLKAREPIDFFGQQFKIAFILRFRARATEGTTALDVTRWTALKPTLTYFFSPFVTTDCVCFNSANLP
jgi:hypothetical protein